MADVLALSANCIEKSYAGVHALNCASFGLYPGEVHALVGENGAGKSTLIKIITGVVQADDGEIKIDGKLITENSPSIAKSFGIAAIYQQPALFPELTVAENLAIGVEKAGWFGRINWSARRTRAIELLAEVGARIHPEQIAGELTMPQQQLVEIARALGADARILIMDEPTASLSEDDTFNLFKVIRKLRAGGVGIIYISHRLEELPQIADRVTVLRDGRTIETCDISSVNRAKLIQMMVGRELSAVFPKIETSPGNVVLELRNFGCTAAGVSGVNLTIRSGEIVGLAGLVGAGRTELARTIFGLTPADEGELIFRGNPIEIKTPSDAIAAGIAFVPEDRRRHGVVLPMAISSNVTLASLKQISKLGTLDRQKERDTAEQFVRRFAIKTPSLYAPAEELSGGNQQKVALSRWLLTNPALLILDEPTQGIDVGAKSEIHTMMCDLAKQGVAILMISSELPEVIAMSDRIAVLSSGTIVKILDRSEASQESIMALALQGLDRAA